MYKQTKKKQNLDCRKFLLIPNYGCNQYKYRKHKYKKKWKKRFKKYRNPYYSKKKKYKKRYNKRIDKSECKYYICKEKGHLANECPNKRTKKVEGYVVIPDISEISDSETIYEITSNESESD